MRSIPLQLRESFRSRTTLLRRRYGVGRRFVIHAVSYKSDVGLKLCFHHLIERKMLPGIAKAVRCTVGRQVWIADKFENRGRERLAVSRLNEQTVLPMLNDFRDIADLCGDDGTPAGKG